MKRFFKILVLIILITSCKESFETGDAKKFNKLIENRTDIKTPEGLMKFYYDPDGYNTRPEYTITTKKFSENTYEITLMQEGIEDDSIFGQKVILKAKLNGSVWTVTEIKENCKCQSGRGHQIWSADPCV